MYPILRVKVLYTEGNEQVVIIDPEFKKNHFDFYYSLDDGNSWTLIEEDYKTNSNGYEWIIPIGAVTQNARVKIIATDLGGLSTTAIGEPFQIIDGSSPSVQLTAPADGETIQGGRDYEITWEAGSPNGVWFVELYMLGDRELIMGNPGRYAWSVPNRRVDATSIRVKVTDNNY